MQQRKSPLVHGDMAQCVCAAMETGLKRNWMGSVLLLRTQSFWRRLRFLYPLTAILSFSCPKSWRQPTSSPGFSRRLIRPAIIAGVSLSLLNRGRT
jgi:hypothetical protein